MRKASFVLLATLVAPLFVLNACGGDDAPPPKAPETPPAVSTPATVAVEPPKAPEPAKKSPMELQKDTMMGMAQAFNEHDAKKLSSFYTDGAIVKTAGAPQETSGKEAIAQSYEKLFTAFPDYKGGANRVFVKGDQVAVEWAFNGTHKGDLYGMKATEKPVGSMGMDLDWFTPEGLVKEQHVYYDAATVIGQTGIVKGMKTRPIPTLPGKPEVIVSTNGADEAKNVEVVKAMTAALDGKKEADFLGTMSDDVTYEDYTQPMGMKGKADAKKFFKEMTTGFPDLKNTITNTLAVNDYVISESTMEGTQKGAFFGIPASKKPVSVKRVAIYQLKDGKVAHGWAYANGADFAMQIGLMPKPGAPKPGATGADAKGGKPMPVTSAKPKP